MELILIRHGESIGNRDKIIQGHSCEGLSELGFQQAEKVAEIFNSNDIDGIYSSDTKRAIQTATPLSKKLNLKINTTSNLREAAFGIWEGMKYEDVKEKYTNEFGAFHENYFIRPSWFEAFEKHQERIRLAIQEILKQEKNKRKFAIFTHGGSIKTQIAHFKKLSGKELHEFNQSNCSFCEIHFQDYKYENGNMLYYNKTVVSTSDSVERSA